MRRPARRIAIPVLIVLFALILRVPAIDRWPPAIHQDEAGNGADAWSILTTGADRAGRLLPVFLEGFGAGDNRTALYAYLAIPGVALLGPGTFATRLPAALAGTWTVLATYLLIRRIRGTAAATCAALLLAATPWSIVLSRFGHEASLTPAFIVTALWLATPPRPRWGFAGLVLAAGLYSYASFRIFLPLLLVATLLARGGPRPDRHGILRLAAGLAAGSAPLIIAAALHPDRLLARGASASVFGNLPFGIAARAFVEQYAAHYLPRFLFLRGDANPVQSPAGMGELLFPEILSLAIGVFVAARRRDPWDRLLLIWLALYPIASAASLGDRPEYVPHSLRAAVGLPVFEILSAQGILAVSSFLARRSVCGAGAAMAGWVIASVVSLGLFAGTYTGRWARAVEPAFHAADVRAIRYLAEHRGRFQAAVIRAGSEDPQIYVYAILYRLQTPREYQAAEKWITQTETFHLIRRAGSLHYIQDPGDLERIRGILRGLRVWAIADPGQMRSGRLVAAFPYADGAGGVEVRELDIPPPE